MIKCIVQAQDVGEDHLEHVQDLLCTFVSVFWRNQRWGKGEVKMPWGGTNMGK